MISTHNLKNLETTHMLKRLHLAKSWNRVKEMNGHGRGPRTRGANEVQELSVTWIPDALFNELFDGRFPQWIWLGPKAEFTWNKIYHHNWMKQNKEYMLCFKVQFEKNLLSLNFLWKRSERKKKILCPCKWIRFSNFMYICIKTFFVKNWIDKFL